MRKKLLALMVATATIYFGSTQGGDLPGCAFFIGFGFLYYWLGAMAIDLWDWRNL